MNFIKENKDLNKYSVSVYQTKESEEYLNSVFGEIAQLSKQYKGKYLEEKTAPIYKNIDYKKITEEDKEVMDTIINFLIQCL